MQPYAPALLSEAEFSDFAAASVPLDAFGPGTDRPLVAVRVKDGAPALAAFARTLPCPVVAIGGGSTPFGRGCDLIVDTQEKIERLYANVAASPLAAMVLVQHLRASESLAPTDALTAESFAFSTVQQGPEFRSWRETTQHLPTVERRTAPLAVERQGGRLMLTMSDPASRNAIGPAMRDALSEILDLALIDPTIERVELRASGRCFSVGGDPAEFGAVSDPAMAHWIRALRLPALRLARLAGRFTVRIDGAAIGAGIELAAFAFSVTASPRSWFQLPELAYGLIPGAGGTVSIARRIGRQRTAYLALSMERLPARRALEWGLIDAIEA